MPIKQSVLEAKWYYRALKVVVLLIPPVLLLLLFLKSEVLVCTVAPGSFADLSLRSLLLIALGLVLYYLLIKWGWKMLLYLFFGGLEDDRKGNAGPAGSSGKKIASVLTVLAVLALGLFVASQLGYITLPKSLTGSAVRSLPRPSCPATSAQTSTPCRSTSGGVGVGGVIVRDSCNCPSDTFFSGTRDVITAGGPYKICTCR